MKIYDNGIVREMTEDEIKEYEALTERDEKCLEEGTEYATDH